MGDILIPIARPWLNEREAKAAYDTVLSGWVLQGPKVREFEKVFAEKVGAMDAVAVSSGTAALHLSLLAAGVGSGDEVILPSLTYISCANVIIHVGAKPVFVDVDPITYTLDPICVERAISSRTKCVMLVHQAGMPGDIDRISNLTKRYNLVLIEDAACALGSEYKGLRIGSHSRFVAFSFHPRKILTTGEGGMIAVQNIEDAKELRLLREHGKCISTENVHSSTMVISEQYVRYGFNYRMTDIQAAIGIVQLDKLENIIQRRRYLAELYRQKLGHLSQLTLPIEPPGRKSNWQSFLCLLSDRASISRDELIQKMFDRGITTRPGIMSIHRQISYYEYANLDLPVTEFISRNGIILPMYHSMSEEELNFVCNTLCELLSYD